MLNRQCSRGIIFLSINQLSSIKIQVTRPEIKHLVFKPEVIAMLKQDLPKLKIIGDVFEAHHYVSVNDVREMFSDNEIGGSFFRKEMYRIKTDFFLSSLFNSQKMKKWQHSVDLSNPLKDFDYKEIAAFMNLHNGKYLEVWKGEKNEIRNIEKLALFTRSLQRIEKLNYFKNLPEDVWASCINGIVNTPQEVVPALMQYKYTSLKINNAITDKTKNNSQIEKFIKSKYRHHLVHIN